MRVISFLFFYFIPSLVISQARYFDGNVKDKNDSISISDAHIFDTKGYLRAVTDRYGDFHLQYFEHETFTASCIGYKSICFPVSRLLLDSVIFMAEDTVKLNEIIITPLTANEIISRSIEQIDNFYLFDDITTTGAFKLIVEKDDTIIFSRENIELQVIMKAPDYFPQLMENTKTVVSDNSDEITSAIFGNFESEISNIFYFDHIIRKRGFFNSDNLEMWNFKIAGYTVLNETNMIIISANFIDHTRNLYHASKIYINEEDYGIMKIKFTYNWKKRNYIKSKIDTLWIADVKWEGRANYLKQGKKYTLSNLEYINEKAVYDKNLMHNYGKLYDYEILCNFTSNQIETDL